MIAKVNAVEFSFNQGRSGSLVLTVATLVPTGENSSTDAVAFVTTGVSFTLVKVIDTQVLVVKTPSVTVTYAPRSEPAS